MRLKCWDDESYMSMRNIIFSQIPEVTRRLRGREKLTRGRDIGCTYVATHQLTEPEWLRACVSGKEGNAGQSIENPVSAELCAISR